MNSQCKFATVYQICGYLYLCSKEPQNSSFSFMNMPKVTAHVWQEEQIINISQYDETTKPHGKSAFNALQSWCESRLQKRGNLNLIVCSDGGFYDHKESSAFVKWLQVNPSVKVAAIGVGADLNALNLSQCLNNAKVYTPSEALLAMSNLLRCPLSLPAGWENYAKELLANSSTHSDLDDDDFD